jgi:hypothetical protein
MAHPGGHRAEPDDRQLRRPIAHAVGRLNLFTVHVFVWTLMFFIFLVPISIGTLGVREATFIVVFGLFGVEDEEALAGSFVGLASLLFTVAIGGVVWLAAARGSAREARARNGLFRDRTDYVFAQLRGAKRASPARLPRSRASAALGDGELSPPPVHNRPSYGARRMA